MGDKIYLTGLNGIRAIAALSVVFSHINNRLDYYNLPKSELLDLANFGVTIFFTLSGFLITYLLLKEKEKTGTIDVKKFYIRRILRIWPLYFIYLLIVILLNGISTVQWPILFYLLMLPNFRNSFAQVTNIAVGGKNLTYMVGHYWSLGVEEQFYAFWPWIVKNTQKLLQLLVLFPLVYILLKIVLKLIEAPVGVLTFFHYTRFGCLAIGALGAYLFFNNSSKLSKWFTNKWIEISGWLFLVVVAFNKFHLASIIDHEIVSVVTLVIIINQVNNPKRIVNLENNVFDFLGKISFGIYVYNPLVIYLMAFAINPLQIENSLVKQLTIYATVIPAVLVISFLSYNYFEKIFLKLKYNYAVIPSSSSKTEFQN
jgi:peptidoglycan/LPS O-acetylase OafA/YrhL